MSRTETLTIANGAATSSTFKFSGQRVVGVIIPSAWTDADITFEMEFPRDTYVKVIDEAGAIFKITGVATAASESYLIGGGANQADIVITGPSRGKVVSTNTGSEADVNQGAARTVGVILA